MAVFVAVFGTRPAAPAIEGSAKRAKGALFFLRSLRSFRALFGAARFALLILGELSASVSSAEFQCRSDVSLRASSSATITRSEEHTSELQSHSDLHSFPTRRSSDLICPAHFGRVVCQRQ